MLTQPNNLLINNFLNDNNEDFQGLIEWNDYRIGHFIKKNINKSTYNEDVLFIFADEKSLLFGVADGAGGHPKGKEAAFITGETIKEFCETNSLKNINFVEIIEKINEKVMALKVGAHTTLSFGLINEESFRAASIGDSEVLYWNSFGTPIYSNIPQSPVGHSIEAGHLNQQESLDDPARYMVNNLIGDPVLRVEFATKMLLKKGHTILIGSDGLFDNISHDDLSELIAKGIFEKSFETLVEYCQKQNPEKWKKDDDISFIVIRRIKNND